MDRRPCMCLRFGTIKAGQVRAPEEGLVGSKRVGVFYRGAPGGRLSSVLSLALGPFVNHRDMRYSVRYL